MRVWRGAAVALVAGACATAPGYPTTAAPGPEIDRATRALADAQAAGADSLAADALAQARKTLDEARQKQQGRESDRAAIIARRAMFEASYARALAERELAQRARAEAQRAIESVPPGGAR